MTVSEYIRLQKQWYNADNAYLKLLHKTYKITYKGGPKYTPKVTITPTLRRRIQSLKRKAKVQRNKIRTRQDNIFQALTSQQKRQARNQMDKLEDRFKRLKPLTRIK